MSHKDDNHSASTQRFESKFVVRLMRIGGAAFVRAFIFLSAQVLFASTYDGQGVHLNSGESVQVDCIAVRNLHPSSTSLEIYATIHYAVLAVVTLAVARLLL